jgi:hypothetical protein
VILFVLPGAMLGWLVFIQLWILLLWYRPGRGPFARRLDQFLDLLLPRATVARRRLVPVRGQRTLRPSLGTATLSGLRGPARRWRAQLRGVYAQGYQVASETITSSGDIARGGALVREAVEALKAERARGGAHLSSTDGSMSPLIEMTRYVPFKFRLR